MDPKDTQYLMLLANLYMEPKDLQYLMLLVSLSFFVIIILMISLILYLRRKKVEYIHEKEKERLKYEEQLQTVKEEITNQNLKNISWELHDNIGQLMSVASMETKMLMQEETIKTEKLSEVVDVLGQSIAQIRALSKTLNSDVIQNFGLANVLRNEVERLTRLGLIECKLKIDEKAIIEKSKEIIIFRMLQEFIANTLKHAQATELEIVIDMFGEKVRVVAKDNGVGFDLSGVKANNGLLNMESRAKLIHTEYSIESQKGMGTTMILILDINSENHEKVQSSNS